MSNRDKWRLCGGTFFIQGYEDMLKGDLKDMTRAKRDGYKEQECERRIQFIRGQQLAVKKIKSKVRELGL